MRQGGPAQHPRVPNRERDIFEDAVHAITEHAAKVDDLVEEAIGVRRLALSGTP